MTARTREAPPRAYYPRGDNHTPARATTPGWDTGPERRIDDGRILARSLGWFSIGLGLFELAAPGRLTDFLDIDERHAPVVRLLGAREVAHGAAILAEREPVAGTWSRVAGDLIDLAALGAAAAATGRRDRVALAAAMVAGVAVLDLVAARQLSGRSGARRGERHGRWGKDA